MRKTKIKLQQNNVITRTTQQKKSAKKINKYQKKANQERKTKAYKLATVETTKLSKIKKKVNLKKLEITYLERIVQRLLYFYRIDIEKSESIKKLPYHEFKKLSALTKRTYFLDYQRILTNKNKKLIKLYSRRNLRSEIIVSSVLSKNNKIADSLDLKKYIVQTFNISKSYFSTSVETKVLQKLNINIKKNSFLTILGPSGSGKTTLLNLLSGLDTVTVGDIFINGINLSILSDRDLTYFRKENIGFVFQQYNLLNNLNVRENIEVGAALAKKKDKEFIKNLINMIGLSDHVKKYPYQLSGGEQQRVSIARALAKKPKILFCDEPTGALDQEIGQKVLKIISRINTETKTTVILVTHNRRIAQISDVIMELKKGKVFSLLVNPEKKKVEDLEW